LQSNKGDLKGILRFTSFKSDKNREILVIEFGILPITRIKIIILLEPESFPSHLSAAFPTQSDAKRSQAD